MIPKLAPKPLKMNFLGNDIIADNFDSWRGMNMGTSRADVTYQRKRLDRYESSDLLEVPTTPRVISSIDIWPEEIAVKA